MVEYDPADVDAFIALADAVEARGRACARGASCWAPSLCCGPRPGLTRRRAAGRVPGRAGGGQRGRREPAVRARCTRGQTARRAWAQPWFCPEERLTRRCAPRRSKGAFEITTDDGRVVFSKLKVRGAVLARRCCIRASPAHASRADAPRPARRGGGGLHPHAHPGRGRSGGGVWRLRLIREEGALARCAFSCAFGVSRTHACMKTRAAPRAVTLRLAHSVPSDVARWTVARLCQLSVDSAARLLTSFTTLPFMVAQRCAPAASCCRMRAAQRLVSRRSDLSLGGLGTVEDARSALRRDTTRRARRAQPPAGGTHPPSRLRLAAKSRRKASKAVLSPLRALRRAGRCSCAYARPCCRCARRLRANALAAGLRGRPPLGQSSRRSQVPFACETHASARRAAARVSIVCGRASSTARDRHVDSRRRRT